MVAKSRPRRPKKRLGRVKAREVFAVTIPTTPSPGAPLWTVFFVDAQHKGPRPRPPCSTLQLVHNASKRPAGASPATSSPWGHARHPESEIMEVCALNSRPRGKNRMKIVDLYRAPAPGPAREPCARPPAPCSLGCRLPSLQEALSHSPAPPPPPLANGRLGNHPHSRSTCSVATSAPVPPPARSRDFQACAYMRLSPCQSHER